MRRPAVAQAIGLLAMLAPGMALAAPTLGPAYGDAMVLQRGEPVVLAGIAEPGSTVSARIAGNTGEAEAAADGSFIITLPALKASTDGGDLTLSDGTGSTVYQDILIGDVFLCSGQSNMELPVSRALDTSNQLRLAADDAIRLLKVAQATASSPQDTLAGDPAWKPADRDSVAEFSAACFYMAKQLRAESPAVPVGLIHSNWGGSAARAWLSPAGIGVLYGDEPLELLQTYDRDPLAATRQFVPQWFAWWKAQDGGREPWTDTAMLDWQPIPKFSFWNEWEGTALASEPRANVWLRQTVTLTARQAEQAGTLSIGAIDDLDLTFVNGQPVGYTFGWGVERTYEIPAGTMQAGENEILIAANNMWDTGGFFAGPDRLYYRPEGGDPIPLGADWEYALTDVTGAPPRAPWDANAGLGVMHNAMIAPLGPMRLAGVAWYQGEADVGQAGYDDRLRELFAGWRAQFGSQAKMLVVQLADFGERRSRPGESAWAQLRQSQLDAAAGDANAVLVSAIDIGEPTDIHPANKNDLGKRLAMALGAPMPMPESAVRDGDWVTVRFSGIEGKLQAQGGPYPLGVELCGDAADTCRWAIPGIRGDSLLVPVPAGSEARRIRHAWADAPIVNLYDSRGVPVPGFEIEVDSAD